MSKYVKPAAIAGTLAVAAASFALSAVALTDLARSNGVTIPWLAPVSIDVTILTATLGVVVLQRKGYAWCLLLFAAALSVAGNVAHAWEYGPVGWAMAAAWPLMLVGITELTVRLCRPVTLTVSESVSESVQEMVSESPKLTRLPNHVPGEPTVRLGAATFPGARV